MVSCVCVQVLVLENDKGNCSPNSFLLAVFTSLSSSKCLLLFPVFFQLLIIVPL